MSVRRKAIIEYEEYLRLKDIESKYHKLCKDYEQLKDKSDKIPNEDENSSSTEQTGSGATHISPDIRHIVDLVKQELTRSSVPFVPSPQKYLGANPTEASLGHPAPAEVKPFSVNKVKSDLNDKFDEKKLLQKVSKEHRQSAIQLLNAIESRPNEISFNSEGIIFVDEESIPSSNIFKFFPLLFKNRAPKRFTGFQDFVDKLQQMGLGHFIQYPIPKEVKKIDQIISKSLPRTSTSEDHWWYLGEQYAFK
ncbi:MAG: hypothetical protein FJ333_07655 [Sphingomonadales bacterium]|nr:hypothetical protein [Sphingomonadales bacterium]